MSALVLGSFNDAHALTHAVTQLRERGHAGIDSYSPYPLHGGDQALGLSRSTMPRIALTGAVLGGATGYLMQWYISAVDYPLNAGGRPMHSPPAFMPVTFELTILFTALFIFFGLMWKVGLPRPHHTAFELPAFASATTHAFWLSLPAPESSEALTGLLRELSSLGAADVSVVEEEVRR